MQNSEFRNPSFKWRVAAVAVVYGVIGAVAGSLVGAIFSRFFVCALVGGSIAAICGALIEAQSGD